MTVKNACPIPRMNDCIDFFCDATLFSTLECNTGDWKTSLADEERHNTTFSCHLGLFWSKCLPFGLTNAPLTFQREIQTMRSGLWWTTCLIFLDDIIVVSKIPTEHQEHLQKVLAVLTKAGVALKAQKCHLFETEVEYLKSVLSSEELWVIEKNMKALR